MTEEMTNAMQTMFSTVQSDVTSMIMIALPAGLAIVGLVMAITIGIKTFKKITSKA